MRNLKTVFMVIILIIISSCGSLPAQKVTLDEKSIAAIKFQSAKKSRAERFINCVKDMNFEGLKQSLIVEACEAAMGSIR